MSFDKNPLGLHQTEIIASLALDLLCIGKKIINPITNEPFKTKFGISMACFPALQYFLLET